MKINEINKSSWNTHAERYQKDADFSYDVVDYGDTRCLNENDLMLIGDVKGLEILELGCGSANCGIALAKKGASMTCVDISEKQIEFAKQNTQRENVAVEFYVSPMEQIAFLQGRNYDKIISIAALAYVKDIEIVFRHAYELLKPGGEFVFSTTNPIFYSVAAMLKIYPNDDIDDSYFYNGEEKWKWEDQDDFEFVTYRRPISEIINLLIKQGFNIREMHELSPKHKYINNAEQELENKFPKLLVLKAKKRLTVH